MISQTRDGKLRAAVPSPLGSCVFLNDVEASEMNAALKKHKELMKSATLASPRTTTRSRTTLPTLPPSLSLTTTSRVVPSPPARRPPRRWPAAPRVSTVSRTPPPTVPPALPRAASAARCSLSFHDLGFPFDEKKPFDTTALDVLTQKKTSPLGARKALV
jgi:hypothetical protein